MDCEYCDGEESKSTDTYVEMIEGFRFDKGMLSPYFVNEHKKMVAQYSSPLTNTYYSQTIQKQLLTM